MDEQGPVREGDRLSSIPRQSLSRGVEFCRLVWGALFFKRPFLKHSSLGVHFLASAARTNARGSGRRTAVAPSKSPFHKQAEDHTNGFPLCRASAG